MSDALARRQIEDGVTDDAVDLRGDVLHALLECGAKRRWQRRRLGARASRGERQENGLNRQP